MNARFFPPLQRTLPLLLACLALPLALSATDNVTVQNTTYTTGQSPTVQADNTITATPAVVINNGANVTFQAGAHATLGVGFRVDAGGVFRSYVGQSLPYATSFESAQGFTTGSIGSQRGWLLLQGAAEIGTATASDGSNSLTLSANTPATSVQQGFLAAGSSIAFVDLRAKPVATASAANSSVIQTESAAIGFQIAGGEGAIYVYDGVGANQWIATNQRFAFNGSNQATSWSRLTIRADYTNKKWDLYVDGQLVDYDLAFLSSSETFLRTLTFSGTTSAAAYLDAIGAQTTNPLFTDADQDGLPDSWESTHALNPALDDRNADKDSDGKTNIEEYFAGTSASNPDVTPPAAPNALTIFATAPTVIGLSWSGASDTGAGTAGIAGYHVYRDGLKVSTGLVTGTNFTATGLAASTSYSFTVKTVDLAGNVSATSASLILSTLASSTSGAFEVFSPLP